MNERIINGIKSQLWSHLQDLRGRVEEVRKLGYCLGSEFIIDQLGTQRKGHFLLDQYLFCTSEIGFWKELTS